MGEHRLPDWARAFLLAQAVGVLVWWLCLWLVPVFRSYFILANHEGVLWAFAIPDLSIFLVLGLIGCFSRKYGRVAAAIIPASALYPTLFCLGYLIVTGAGSLGLALMLLMLAANGYVAKRLSVET